MCLRGFCAGGKWVGCGLLCATVHPAFRDVISYLHFASSKALKEKAAAVQVSNSETQRKGIQREQSQWVN